MRRFGMLLVAASGVCALTTVPQTASEAELARTCLGHAPTVRGDASDEDFVGTEARDVILAAGGDDSIHGLGGDDLLCGGRGRDQIDGGQGIRGGTGDDRIDGGPGRDDLLGYAGRDRIRGGSGNDDLNGGAGRDGLYGERGNDTLTGDNPPVDRRVRDICRGGNGKDRYYFC